MTIDVEQMLRDTIPGGSSCDPQQVADDIRGWVAKHQEQAALASTAPQQPVSAEARDAARWRMLPAFFEEYQIDAMKLYRDIDAALSPQQAEQGKEQP